MLSKIRTSLQSSTQPGRGQGLVEMAIITPILVFMLIGLFEVGYALWGYMTLLNIDREATRFASIPGALNFKDPSVSNLGEEVGYNSVIAHALLSNSGQLKLQEYLANTENNTPDTPKAAIIITHIVADTRIPCDIDATPNCYQTANCASDDYVADDMVANPEMPGYEFYRYSYPEGQTVFRSQWTGTDLISKTLEIKQKNNEFNCNLWNRVGVSNYTDFPDNSVIIIEMYYEQPQLLGFPLFSWMLNPLPLQVQTTMRLETEKQGLCELYPITISSTTDGEVDFSWVSWDASAGRSLEDEFSNLRLATNEYQEPGAGGDTKLNIGDRISELPGIHNTADIQTAMDNLQGLEIMIPVHNGGYTVIGFAKVIITHYDLPNKRITIQVNDPNVSWACPGDGS
ncbi:MAG: hypothetical protein B6I38_05935 [Anaerolineaceae bacterium 4572_5.1]|nr:MAG: hypothetical protein B6I38_05935 [Anaerolineaceae bacterium 4572_5.1]